MDHHSTISINGPSTVNNFINLSKTGIVHQDLQPSRMKRNLNDAQFVMDLLKYIFINSSWITLSCGIIPTEVIRRDLENAYDIGKSAMDSFIDLGLVNMSKSIYDPLKKLRLGTFANMNKKVKVKVKGREVQFSSQTEIFESVPYALADSMGTMIKTKKADLLAELEIDPTYVNSFPGSSCSI